MYKELHDTHLHLDLYDNIQDIISEIDKLEISVIAVTNLPVLYERIRKKVHSKSIEIALGFHPELILEYEKYIPKMWDYLKIARFIGEVGLDFSKRNQRSWNNQIDFFTKLIKKCNSIGDKMLSIHSRKAEEEALNIIGKDFRGSIIFHWFSGSMQVLDRAINCGHYFSINSAMVNSTKGRKIIEKIPVDRILLESDGPFIKFDNNPMRPKNLRDLANSISEILSLNQTEMDKLLNENFSKLLTKNNIEI